MTAPDEPVGMPAEPRWPTARPWPRARKDESVAPAVRAPEPVIPASAVSAMWAESARQVLGSTGWETSQAVADASYASALPARAAAQPDNGRTSAHACSRCGLALSVNARFCRRCGMQQG